MQTNENIKSIHTIGILGGTGKEGKGLAYRWVKAGYNVVIGSRQIEKAQAARDELRAKLTERHKVEGMLNSEVAASADIVVITVPYAAHKQTLEGVKAHLEGKILIDVTVPLAPPKVSRVQMPPDGSAAQEAKKILGEGAQVVAAFQNISYDHLMRDEPVDCDVLVCGTGKAAREIVLGLVKDAGLVGWDAGPIENAVVVEGLTSVLIGLNQQYGVESSGIRVTGIKRK